MKKLVIYFCFSLFPCLVFAQPNANKQRPTVDIEYDTDLAVGKQFLSFSAVTLDGETVNEQSLKGKVTLVNFWFEGCPPCVAEFDAISSLYCKYKDNPNIEVISFTKDDTEVARKAVKDHGIPYAVCALSSKECSRLKFEIGGYPANMIVDKQGNIVYLHTGGYADKEKAVSHILEVEKKMLEELAK